MKLSSLLIWLCLDSDSIRMTNTFMAWHNFLVVKDFVLDIYNFQVPHGLTKMFIGKNVFLFIYFRIEKEMY